MMVRYALALLAAPVMLAAMPAQIAHAQQKADDLKQVSAYIRAVKTMTADFKQTDRNGRTLSGKLTLKQPGKIRSEESRVGEEGVSSCQSWWSALHEQKKTTKEHK